MGGKPHHIKMEGKTMEENIIKTEEAGQAAVDQAFDAMFKAAENVDKVLAEKGLTKTADVPASPGNGILKDVLIGGAGLAVGSIGGYCWHRWGEPKLKSAWKNHQEKKARKKAEKAAKKARKKAEAKSKQPVKVEKPVNAGEAEPNDDGVDPRDINTDIDNV